MCRKMPVELGLVKPEREIEKRIMDIDFSSFLISRAAPPKSVCVDKLIRTVYDLKTEYKTIT